MNRDDKDFTIIPGISPEQDSRKDHDHKERYLRKTIASKLPLLRERAYDFNDIPLHERLFSIDGVVAYGSYCNSDREKIGDLDIGILFSPHGDELLFPEESVRLKSCRIYLDKVEHDPRAYDYGPEELQHGVMQKFGMDKIMSRTGPYFYAENNVAAFLKKGIDGPKLNFLEIHEMKEAIELAEDSGEIPFMFYGNFMWIARCDEEKCQEIDRKVEGWRKDKSLQIPNHDNGGTAKAAELKEQMVREGKPYGHSNQVGEFLKKEMEEKGISKEVIADKVGCSPATVSGWLKGKTIPSFRSQWKIEAALGLRKDKAKKFDKLISEQQKEKQESDTKIHNAMWGLDDDQE